MFVVKFWHLNQYLISNFYSAIIVWLIFFSILHRFNSILSQRTGLDTIDWHLWWQDQKVQMAVNLTVWTWNLFFVCDQIQESQFAISCSRNFPPVYVFERQNGWWSIFLFIIFQRIVPVETILLYIIVGNSNSCCKFQFFT